MATKAEKSEKAEAATETGRSSARGLFAFKAMATTVGGGIITMCIALAQAWYSDHLEILRRQGEQGTQYQEELIGLTGRIEVAYHDIVGLVRRGTAEDLRQAAVLLEGPFEDLGEEWQRNRLLLRNRGAELYGRRVGNFVYDLAERSCRLDQCNVVVRIGDPAADRDCAARRRAEGDYLTGLVREIGRSHDLGPLRSAQGTPVSYSANLDLASILLRRYIPCRTAPQPPQPPPRCQDPEQTLAAIMARSDLLTAARINLATAIMDRSALAR